MHMGRKFVEVLFGLALGAPAWAQQWFAVTGPLSDGTVVEIDLDTVRIRNHGGEGVIRVTFDTPQFHNSQYTYRSLVATTQLDCTRRIIVITSAAYFAQSGAQGERLGADSAGREAGVPPELLERIPAAARQAILRATCAAQN